MGGFQEAHTGNGLVDKLSNSLLTDPNRIPYVQMNDGRRKQSSCDKSFFLIVPLLIFLGLSALLLLVVTQEEYFVTYNETDDLLQEKPEFEKLQWDELIFTQLWGYSSCIQFKDKHFPKDVTCRYEKQPAFWSIHGIWPTREGSEGPNFCTKVKFNVTLLEPIRSSLDEYWYEIDNTKGGDFFWSHEWVKHGSCAKELDTFGTELKYFSAALDLRQKFDLYSMLKDGNIIPESARTGSGYNLGQITDAIINSLGKTAVPYVQCLEKKNTNTNKMEYFLLAIELCFDKDLQSIPCKGNKQLSKGLKDSALPCPANAPIHYLDATL